MPTRAPVRRLLLLGLSLLSGCAAGGMSPEPAAQAASPENAGLSAYLSGRFAELTGSENDAATLLLAALAENPGSPTLKGQAFVACLLAGRPEAKTLAAQMPGQPVTDLLLGDDAARRGDWAGARHYYSALTGPLADYLGPMLMAWAEAGARDTDAALATLQPKLQDNAQSADYALQSALIADLGDRFPEAQKFYDMAQADAGGLSLRLARIVANWDERQGRAQDATALIQSIGRNAPGLAMITPGLLASVSVRPVRDATQGLAGVYIGFASQLRAQSAATDKPSQIPDTDSIQIMLRLALALSPSATDARLALADALVRSGSNDAALAALAPVPPSDPLAPLVSLRIAGIQSSLTKDSAAETTLRQLAARLPDQPEPLAALADLQAQMNHPREAIVTYGRAIALAPPGASSSWPLYFARAVAEQQDNDWPASEADLKRALALSPDQPEVLNFLGYAWADRGQNLVEAHSMLSRAAAMRPDDGAIIDSLGWVELRQGDVHDAVRALEKAVRLDPADPEINGHLGDAYWDAGRKLQARYQWQLALALKPAKDAVPKLEEKLHNAERDTETTRR
jgi:tetratricopeptide (TPR) repeat protein